LLGRVAHMKRVNIFWFFIGAVALGVAFGVQSPSMAFVVYAFVLLVVIANVSSRLWLAGLDCERTVQPTTLWQGEEAEVIVEVHNRRGWPIPWIYVEDTTPPGFPTVGERCRLAVLMPGRSLTLNYRIRCPKRGYHKIGPLLMESGDLFGLQKRFRTGKRQDYVSVLPTVAYIETFTISARRPQGPVRISHRAYEDPTRISGLREYVPGDPLNRIHWKASARAQQLYVKTNEPSNVLGATLLLDLFHVFYLDEAGEERMELAITTAASLAYLLQLSGEQVGLLTNARDAAEVARYELETQETFSRQDAEDELLNEVASVRISPLEVPTRRSPVQARTILENLARVLPTDSLDAASLIMASYERLPRDAALIPIVPKVTPELVLALATMKESGFAVTVFLIKNSKDHMNSAAALASHHINLIHIEHERDLHEISPQYIGR